MDKKYTYEISVVYNRTSQNPLFTASLFRKSDCLILKF